MKKRIYSLLLTSVFAAWSISAWAATDSWIAGSGDWGVATNWSLNAAPGPNDVAIIPAGPAITIIHSSNNDIIVSLQSSQAVVLGGGAITVTSNASVISGSLTISNGSTLAASGVNTTFLASGAAAADDANFTVTGGAVVTLSNLKNFTKECNGSSWLVSGSNSVLNLPGLTNMSGIACSYPTIQAEAGGQILAPNVQSIVLGPQIIQADGSNSLIDLTALTNCAGINGFLMNFEASAGGSIRIPNLAGSPSVGVTINPGGTIPTAQFRQLATLSLMGMTNNLNILTNLVNLTVSNAAMVFPALTNFDDGNVTVLGGATVLMPAVKNYTKTSCYGDNWTVNGAQSLLWFPALTNLSGETCNYPVIQAQAGGTISMTNVVSIVEGPLTIQADGSNSLVDLSNLTNCAGQQGYLLAFEASGGGTIRIPRVTGGPLVEVTLNLGGTIPTAQLQMLDTLTLNGVTNNFNALTNLVNLTVTTVPMTFPALSNFDNGNISLSGGAVVTLPALKNFTKSSCTAPFWTVTDAGSILNLPSLTNLSGNTCNFPVIQAQAGGQILATNLASVFVAPLTFQADGAGSLIDLSGLTQCAGQEGYLLAFEASSGGTVRIPHVTGGPLVGITVNPGGTIPTAQIQVLNSLSLPGVTNNFNGLGTLVNLTVNGVTMHFPALTNFDDGNVSLTGGAVVTFPALTNYTKTSCYGDNWNVNGAGTILNLPALTNISGETCNFPVIQAEAGGEILMTNLAFVGEGPLTIQADGINSLVDMTNLTGASGQQNYLISLEASAGGTLRLPHLANGHLLGFTFAAGGTLNPTNLTNLTQSDLILPGGSVTLPLLRNMDLTSFNVSGGAVLNLPALGSYAGGISENALWVVDGAGSEAILPGLTNLTGDGAANCTFGMNATGGGELLMSNLQSIASGNVSFLSTNAGSVIDLSSLSGFVLQNGQGSLTALSGGIIRLNTQAFLLANVSINIPAGNPVLPPTLIASSSLTLYGQTGHSYLVQQRNTLVPNSPFTFLARVPLTNAFEAIAPVAPPNIAYLVTEFVADPPLLDGTFTGSQIQFVLYGATNKSYQIQSATNLTRSIVWTNIGLSVTMTNAFKFLPPVTPAVPVIYYRAQQL